MKCDTLHFDTTDDRYLIKSIDLYWCHLQDILGPNFVSAYEYLRAWHDINYKGHFANVKKWVLRALFFDPEDNTYEVFYDLHYTVSSYSPKYLGDEVEHHYQGTISVPLESLEWLHDPKEER